MSFHASFSGWNILAVFLPIQYNKRMRIAHSSIARLAVVVVAVFGLLAVAVPADAVTTTATIIPSPNSSPTDGNILKSVSCVSISWCVAVGESNDGTASQALVEMWDGTTWSIVPSPTSQLINDSTLNSVSCVSVSWCVAVGSGSDGVATSELIEAWDGSSWSIQRAGGGLSGMHEELNSVSCVSVSWCVAVGFYTYAFHDQNLDEAWDGTSWHKNMVPSTSPTDDNGLNSVSCVSVSWCVAVGGYDDGSANRTLVTSWDGMTWTISPSPNESSRDRLTGVSCVSVTFCLAVGTYLDSDWRTLAEVWNGTTWSVVPSANAADENGIVANDELDSVSCVTASSCMAVGNYKTVAAGQNLVETWDGSTWSVMPSENAGTDNNFLVAVSCAADASCVAVGHYVSDANQTLVLSLTESEPPITTTTSAPPADPVAPAFTG